MLNTYTLYNNVTISVVFGPDLRTRVVVSVSTSRSRNGVETYQCLVSVSAIDVSCPRPILRQILQVTVIKLTKSVVAVKEFLAELV